MTDFAIMHMLNRRVEVEWKKTGKKVEADRGSGKEVSSYLPPHMCSYIRYAYRGSSQFPLQR